MMELRIQFAMAVDWRNSLSLAFKIAANVFSANGEIKRWYVPLYA
jgi:hypothetical protein